MRVLCDCRGELEQHGNKLFIRPVFSSEITWVLVIILVELESC